MAEDGAHWHRLIERRQITVSMSRAELTRLDRLSFEQDVSRSELVRRAVAAFLAREGKRSGDAQ
jgi:metal-responsive CopG/Arc/MetJ family transcriptional regulator